MRKLTIVGAAIFMAVAGCSSATGQDGAHPQGATPATPTASTQPRTTLPPGLEKLVAAAENANVAAKGTIIRSGARPTLADQGSGVQTMIIGDKDDRQWEVGTYRLTTYCVGSGSLYAVIQIGATTQAGNLPCSTEPQSLNVDITLPVTSSGLSVHIVPLGETAAGVAYQISKLQQ